MLIRFRSDRGTLKMKVDRISILYHSNSSTQSFPSVRFPSLAVSRLRLGLRAHVHMAAVVMVPGGRAGGALSILPYYASAVPHAKETVGGSLQDTQWGLREGQTPRMVWHTPVGTAPPPEPWLGRLARLRHGERHGTRSTNAVLVGGSGLPPTASDPARSAESGASPLFWREAAYVERPLPT